MSKRDGLPLPPIEVLRARYAYDPDTGEVTNKWGRVVGGKTPGGYLLLPVRLAGVVRNLLIHRLAYALHHGADPHPYEIDHINRVRDDNRACNLRLVTPKQQSSNRHYTRLKKVKITTSDGGSVIARSAGAAAFILQCPRNTLHSALHRGQQHLRRHGETYTITCA